MGVLTDDMARLRGEIESMRDARGELNRELAQGAQARANAVAATRAHLQKAHADMAGVTRVARQAFVSRLETSVAAMRAGFRKAHAKAAKAAKADRVAFVAGNRRGVARARKELATDMAGAHRAWLGLRDVRS